jgi:hypothetical protein
MIELNSDQATTVSQRVAVVGGVTYRWSFAHRGRDDTDTVEVLINGRVVERHATSERRWRVYSGEFRVPPGDSEVTFGLRAVDSGSRGNVVDAVVFEAVVSN